MLQQKTSIPRQVEWQRPHLYEKQLAAIFTKCRYAVIEASTKAGKAQPLDATIYTPTGPVRMGDIHVGSVVFSHDGQPTRVLGVYPQGLRPIYRVTFSDRSSTEVDLEHVWEVGTFSYSKIRKFTTAELLTRNFKEHFIRIAAPVSFIPRAVPVDPYLLGVLIGDGTLGPSTVGFSCAEPELVTAVSALLPDGHYLRKEPRDNVDYLITAGKAAASLRERKLHLCGWLRTLGLMGKRSHEKRIPSCYLYNTAEVRLAVLQGILDTDGWVDDHGQPWLQQTSPGLAEDVRTLVQSLGGTVKLSINKNSHYRDKAGRKIICQHVYNQLIRLPDARICFRLKRKADKARPRKKTGVRVFQSIEFVGYKQAQCIEVAHPSHLYLTDEFIVTHNTVGCLTWLIEQAVLGKDGRNYWWIAPSFRQASIAFRRAKGGLSKGTFTSNDTNLMLKLCNGTMIWFISGEIPDNLYGEDVFACVIDEASRLREAAWHAVRSTLTATRGPIRIIGNVKGRKSWFYKLARKAEAGEPDMHFARIQAKDAVAAGVLDAAEIEDAKSKLPENVFKELYEAEPGDDSGNPFGLEAIKKCVRLLSLTNPICYGIDLAKSTDWTVVIGLDESGNCCYYERFQRPWLETVKRIKDVVGHTQCLLDSTGVGDAVVEFIQRNYGSNFEGFKFSATSKQQLMEGLALAIQGAAITYPQEVADELEEFEYTYTRTGVFYSAPEGLHDDCVCALALANQKLSHLTGAMGLLRHYQNMAQAASAEQKPEKAPGIRPVPPKPPADTPSPVKAYEDTLSKLAVKDVCFYCGGSLATGRCTDGFKSWCQACDMPDWARQQKEAERLPKTCDVTFPEA